MLCPNLRIFDDRLVSCHLFRANLWKNRGGMPCEQCLEATGGSYPCEPIPTVHAIEFKIPEQPAPPTIRGPCFHRALVPIERSPCGCERRFLFRCDHPDRGGLCNGDDCDRCTLWEET